mmetsp:Transcript_34913/g.56506  ORF Transcript_34913/g.56506 Transcript_34913/m.56506 type:complete len:648 (+) Transcript_34913:172-2115(+)|eukprot:CAMPEP_0184647406 /NCGR_PEP_ID=MMETSP0308-20130426/4321_1 /TAXON_ID=38269 /ORGANISM="Gloeochaete witrockiana, Strain SAG 46.84" /LENGTH=647 /DNA_ID=CAMNT_0027078329 /DNA_START=170 /DNA_END=2113 /DNA_ORIENTATION=+
MSGIEYTYVGNPSLAFFNADTADEIGEAYGGIVAACVFAALSFIGGITLLIILIVDKCCCRLRKRHRNHANVPPSSSGRVHDSSKSNLGGILALRIIIGIIGLGLLVGGILGIVGSHRIGVGSQNAINGINEVTLNAQSANVLAGRAATSNFLLKELQDTMLSFTDSVSQTTSDVQTSIQTSPAYTKSSEIRRYAFIVLCSLSFAASFLVLLTVFFEPQWLMILALVLVLLVQPLYWIIFAVYVPIDKGAVVICGVPPYFENLARNGLYPAQLVISASNYDLFNPIYFAAAPAIINVTSSTSNDTLIPNIDLSGGPFTKDMPILEFQNYLRNFTGPEPLFIKITAPVSYQSQLEALLKTGTNEVAGLWQFHDALKSEVDNIIGPLQGLGNTLVNLLAEGINTFEDFVQTNINQTLIDTREACAEHPVIDSLIATNWTAITRNSSDTQVFPSDIIEREIKCINPSLEVYFFLLPNGLVTDRVGPLVERLRENLAKAIADKEPSEKIDQAREALNDAQSLLDIMIMFEVSNFAEPLEYLAILYGPPGVFSASSVSSLYEILTVSVCRDLKVTISIAYAGFLLISICCFVFMITGPILYSLRSKAHSFLVLEGGETPTDGLEGPGSGEKGSTEKPPQRPAANEGRLDSNV